MGVCASLRDGLFWYMFTCDSLLVNIVSQERQLVGISKAGVQVFHSEEDIPGEDLWWNFKPKTLVVFNENVTVAQNVSKGYCYLLSGIFSRILML